MWKCVFVCESLLLILTACVWESQCKSLVLAGGAMSSTSSVWSRIIDLAGGTGSARIGVISAASSTPESSGQYYVDLFTNFGARAEWIPIHEGNMDANTDPTVVNQINGMTGYFFSGGDQARIINSFFLSNGQPSPALEALRNIYSSGGVVSGSSAGTACMPSAVMVMGGMSWEALRYGACEYTSGCNSGDLQYYGNGGIAVLNGFIPDTHFSERGREGRLVRLLSDTRQGGKGADYGIGVDEDTALVITDVDTHDMRGEVLGYGGVLMPDISQSSVDSSAPYWRISRVYAHYLTEGDSIIMRTRNVTFAAWKSNLSGQERYEYPLTSEMIFKGNRESGGTPEFVRVSTSLFDSYRENQTWGRTEKRDPIFRVKFFKSGATGFGGYSPSHGGWRISYSQLEIEMGPD